jgi:hypothetical protein
MGQTLLGKVWDAHTVRRLSTGQTQLFIGLHLVHEVTSPQAFDALRARGWPVRFPHRTFATVDHVVPTSDTRRPFADELAEEMMSALERNCREFGIPLGTCRIRTRGSSTSSDRSSASRSQGSPSPAATATHRRTAPLVRSRSASAPRRFATCSPRSAWPWTR